MINYEMLEKELHKYQMNFETTTLAKLNSFILLISKWNKIHNLTGLNNFEEMFKTHVVDSLIALKYLDDALFSKNLIEVIDIGSGNGTPGIPWAIAKKEINLSLVEKNKKKAAFLRSAVHSLELKKRVNIYNKRFENLSLNKTFDVITSRALMGAETFISNTFKLGSKKTVWLIMTTDKKIESLKKQFLEAKGLEKVFERTYELECSAGDNSSKKSKKKVVLIQNIN